MSSYSETPSSTNREGFGEISSAAPSLPGLIATLGSMTQTRVATSVSFRFLISDLSSATTSSSGSWGNAVFTTISLNVLLHDFPDPFGSLDSMYALMLML